jgi:hypothetical protein
MTHICLIVDKQVDCEHPNLIHCPDCDVVYCLICEKEWVNEYIAWEDIGE